MRKYIHALLVLPMLLLGVGCVPKGSPVPVPVQSEPQAPAFGKTVTMQVNQTVKFEDGLTVLLEKINDSRCPKGVQCIWAGELSPVLQLSGGGFKEQAELVLGTVRSKDSVTSGYHFTLVNATESSIDLLVVKSPASAAQDARIKVTVPLANQLVKSPLTVTGEAKGSWYFEASFPVKLVNAAGVELASAPAKALGDWMVDGFVPFSVTLKFAPQPVDSEGKLILKRDNPSGLPENDASISIPVKF